MLSTKSIVLIDVRFNQIFSFRRTSKHNSKPGRLYSSLLFIESNQTKIFISGIINVTNNGFPKLLIPYRKVLFVESAANSISANNVCTSKDSWTCYPFWIIFKFVIDSNSKDVHLIWIEWSGHYWNLYDATFCMGWNGI